MILIAESGSTKTDWKLISNSKVIETFHTKGLNPYFVNIDQISIEIGHALTFNSVAEIYFYGAGCSTEEQKEIIIKGIKNIFPQSKVFVDSDMIAAARALFGKQGGIAAIIGTGSNSCVYDGEKIISNTNSLGYILGDEGSGAHLGKQLMKAYLDREMPDKLHKSFEDEYQLTKDQILHSLYKQPEPNRYLASFAPFLEKHIDDEFAYNMVYRSFEEFCDKHICKYDNYKQFDLRCTGSIAYHYQDILMKVTDSKGIKLKEILKSPLDKLVGYHS